MLIIFIDYKNVALNIRLIKIILFYFFKLNVIYDWWLCKIVIIFTSIINLFFIIKLKITHIKK